MNVCIFCGSSTGKDARYGQVARDLGRSLALARHRLIYGAGNVGLMGILADAVLENGGEVVGVIPEFLVEREVAHTGITQLEVVGSMHLRKQRMADLAEAFVAIPGGWGTLDELAEILTWKQLGLISPSVYLLNANEFFSPLLSQMRLMVREGFLAERQLSQLQVVEKVPELMDLLHG